MNLKDVYTVQGDKTKGTLTVFFQYLGFSLNGFKCFALWNEENKTPQKITLTDRYIKNNLLNKSITH